MSHEEEKGKKKAHGGHGHGPPHGGHEEAHEGAPEWLISFADNVTLMMGFFVILLAMTLSRSVGGSGGDAQGATPQQPNSTILDAAIAIRQAFNNPVDLGSSDPNDIPLIRRIHERGGESEANQDGQKGRDHDVRSIREGKYYRTGGSIEFDLGSAVVSDSGRQELADLARQLNGHNLIVEIRGNVSSAEAFDRLDRGVRLSFERAVTVAEILVAGGLRWGQLRIAACADSDRLVTLAYEASAHRANQRVEIVVTDQKAQDSANNDQTPAREMKP